jgi:hypothetical protein
MEIRIRLPGDSLAEDIRVAKCVAEVAAQHAWGSLAPTVPPAHATNPCDAGCVFLGEVQDDAGEWWLVYDCNGVVHCYKA